MSRKRNFTLEQDDYILNRIHNLSQENMPVSSSAIIVADEINSKYSGINTTVDKVRGRYNYLLKISKDNSDSKKKGKGDETEELIKKLKTLSDYKEEAEKWKAKYENLKSEHRSLNQKHYRLHQNHNKLLVTLKKVVDDIEQ